jgi:hypothetical protein
MSETNVKKKLFFVGILEVTDEKRRIWILGSVNKGYGSKDPDRTKMS